MPTYNRREITLACIERLKRQTRIPDQIIVSDGGSTDGTCEAIEEAWPDVKVLRTKDDLFWGGAMAAGINFVMAQNPADTDQLLMMNDDTEPPETFVERLSDVCGQQDVAVGPVIVDIEDTSRILSSGVKIDWDGYSFTSDRRALGPEEVCDVDVLPGRGSMLPIRMVREVGNVDHETFPHYIADYDFFLRVRRAGNRLCVTGATQIGSDTKTTGLSSAQGRSLRRAWHLAFSRRSMENIVMHYKFIGRHAPSARHQHRLRAYIVLQAFAKTLPNKDLLRRAKAFLTNPRKFVEEKRLSVAHGRFAKTVEKADRLKLEKIGTEYGGWIVPTAAFDSRSICYCVGVGEDISFDLGIIERFGCDVYAMDPTPRSFRYVESQPELDPRFHFVPVGLWSEDKVMRFYAPKNAEHVSHSILNLQETSDYFEAQCRSLASLMAELGHGHIDLLKIDIEGAEHAVIEAMLQTDIRPPVLCVEVDRPVSAALFSRTMKRLSESAYALVAVDGWNLTFVSRSLLVG